MQTKYKRLAGILLLAMGCQATAVSASTDLINTLGLLNIDTRAQAINEGGWVAGQFSTGTNCLSGCALGDITLRLGSEESAPISLAAANLSLSIYDNNVSDLPGTSIGGTISLLTGGDIPATGWGLYTFQPTPADSITLANDTSYWVRLVSNLPPGNRVVWAFDDSDGDKRAYPFGSFGVQGVTDSAFHMSVEATQLSAIPIPGAIWLMGSALVGLVVRSRRIAV